MGKAPSQPRRIVTRLVVFLLLLTGGAIVNVAVAWACASYAWRTGIEGLSDHGSDPVVEIGRIWPREFQAQEVKGWRYRGPGVAMTYLIGADSTKVRSWFAGEVTSGLPCRSHRGLFWLDSLNYPAGKGKVGLITIPLPYYSLVAIAPAQPGVMAGERYFPFNPIWPGFAINTIFYAAIVWLLWAAPGAIRRMRRRKRGLCIHCAYDLRGAPPDSPNCPECGKPRARLES